jgi:magnesium transporter
MPTPSATPRGAPAATKRRRRRAPPGTPPGTLIADPDALQPVYHVISYGPDGFDEASPADIGTVVGFVGRRPMTWINVDGLRDVEAIRRLGEHFGLHSLSLEDVVNVGQRPKVEAYPEYLFIVVRILEDEGGIHTEQISMFLGRNFLVTFQERAGDCWNPVRDRIRGGGQRLCNNGAGYLAYALLDGVVDLYFPVLERFGERLEALELDVLDRADRETIRALREVKRDLLTLRRTIWPLRETLSGLLRDPTPYVTDEDRVYLRDLYDHSVQVMDLLETYRETGSGLMDVYLSSVNNRMNEIMKVLTLFTSIFIPLSFIASIYGMNFDPSRSPWNMPELWWPYGYLFALALMGATGLGILGYFWRSGWIGDSRRRRPRRPRDRRTGAPR